MLVGGAIIYFIGSIISLLMMSSLIGILVVLAVTTVVSFCYFVYKISSSLSILGLVGVIFFQVLTWSSLFIGVIYLAVKVYNSILASLPI